WHNRPQRSPLETSRSLPISTCPHARRNALSSYWSEDRVAGPRGRTTWGEFSRDMASLPLRWPTSAWMDYRKNSIRFPSSTFRARSPTFALIVRWTPTRSASQATRRAQSLRCCWPQEIWLFEPSSPLRRARSCGKANQAVWHGTVRRIGSPADRRGFIRDSLFRLYRSLRRVPLIPAPICSDARSISINSSNELRFPSSQLKPRFSSCPETGYDLAIQSHVGDGGEAAARPQ